MHGTCVALGGAAALLRGASGSGKSDLALRFIGEFASEGAALVSDDQVRLTCGEGTLIASPPERIAGLLEVRGSGIIKVAFAEQAELAVIADLVEYREVPRMPPDPLPFEEILGVRVSVMKIAPFAASAPLKLKLILGGEI